MWRRLETYKRQLQKTRALITPWYVSFSVLLLLQVNKTNPNRHHRKRRNLSVGLRQLLSWMQMLSQGLCDSASLYRLSFFSPAVGEQLTRQLSVLHDCPIYGKSLALLSPNAWSTTQALPTSQNSSCIQKKKSPQSDVFPTLNHHSGV